MRRGRLASSFICIRPFPVDHSPESVDCVFLIRRLFKPTLLDISSITCVPWSLATCMPLWCLCSLCSFMSFTVLEAAVSRASRLSWWWLRNQELMPIWLVTAPVPMCPVVGLLASWAFLNVD